MALSGTEIYKVLGGNKFDLIAYSGNMASLPFMYSLFKPIQTYQTDGYCALIRNPPGNGFITSLWKAFDGYVWMLLLLSTGFAMVVWQLLRQNGESPFYFVFGLLAYFLLQDIPFQRNRWTQVAMLQVFILMLFVLGNAYQGLMVSMLMDPRKGEQITTADQLFNSSDMTVYADIMFAGMTKRNRPEFFDKLERLPFWLDSKQYLIQFQEIMRKYSDNHALIVLCSYVDRLYDTDISAAKAIEYYYLLPEKIGVFPENILSTRRSPFADRLNEYSMRVFESGISQHWPILLNKFPKPVESKGEIDAEILTLKEIKEAFGIWYKGLLLAFMVFIAEIIWDYCKKYLQKKLEEVHRFAWL